MNEDKLKKAYESAKKHYNLPDFEVFKADMADEKKLLKFRENLSVHYNVPDVEVFKADMGLKKKEETIPSTTSSVASQEVAEPSAKSGVVSDRTKSKIRGLGDSAISEAVEVEQYIDSKEDKVAQSVESISGRFTKGVTEYEDELSDYDSTKKSAISTLRQIQKANKPVYLQDELGNDISVSKQDNLAAERLNPLTKELYQKGAATIENTRKAFKANYIDENPEIIAELESDDEDKVEAANKKIFDAWVKEPEILSGNERVRKGRSFIEVTYDSFREGMDERDYNVMIAQDLSSATEEEAKKILEMEYKNYLDKGADIQYNDSYEIPKMFGSQAVPIARGTALSLIPGAGTAASIIYGASDAAITSYGAEYLGSYIQARAQGMKEDESFDVAKNQANLAAGIGAVEGALGSFTGRLSTKLGGKLGGYASKALKPLITSATTGASDAGLDAAAAGIGQVINNGYAQSQDLNRGLFDGVADEMIGEIIFSTGMKIPTTVNTVADFRKYVKSLPIKEQQKILNNVIDNKENIERKILNDRTNDYLNLKGQEALNDGDEQLASKVKENPLEVLKNDLARLQKVKDNIKDETAIVEIDKNISAITQMIDNVEKRVVVKEGDVENILSTDDIKDKINDEDFVAKVANGEIDIKISNDEKLGNDLAKKVEEYKNKQNDSENKTGVSSEEQTGEKFVEKQSIEKTGDETVETGGVVQKTKVKDNEYAKSEVERVKSLPIENEDGATMNLDGSKYEKGGLVIPLTSKNVKASELTPEMIDDFIDENSESIGGETVKVGIYKFPNQDQASIDLNIVADPSMREDALKIGLELGQKSLYDLNTGKSIETGADGMNPKVLTTKEFLDIQNRLTKAEPKVIPAGKRLFNEPNPETIKISRKYKEKKGLNTSDGEKIFKVDTDKAMKIADEYDKMQDNPDDPEVQKAYEDLADETAEQYNDIVDAGYVMELWQGEGEPYKNAQEMIDDLKNNKHMYVFSTEQGFGETDITEEQRNKNKLLQDSGFKDITGKPLLYNDVFRFVHDFFGHSERGNGFGAIGEENAWDVHARMFSPLARRAMTTETKGQNSWVNFGKQMRKPDGSLYKKGEEGYLEPKERSFAEQKMGLLPEWVSEFDGDKKQEEKSSVRLSSKDRVFNEINSIADKVKAKTSSKANPKEVNKRIFNDAVSYLQQSKWYEEASDVDRENAYREVAKMFGQPIKKSPSLKVKDTSKKISITEKEGLVKQIKDTMKGFKEGMKSQQNIAQEVKKLIKEFSVKGYINNTQLKALTNKALSVRLDNIKSQNDFASYFNKVMDDVDYDRKLSEASKVIKSAKKKSKSKSRLYNLAALDKLVSQIDPTLVEDMDALLLALNEYNSDKPVANVSENTANLQKFVDETNTAKEEKLRDSTKERLSDVLGDGDFDGLTTKEMLELLDSVEDVNENAEEKLEGKKNILRKAVRPIQMLLSNYDKTSENELDSDEKAFLDKLASVDPALLSLNDLKNLFIVGNNILINNNFANAGNLSTRFGTIMGINKLAPTINNNRTLKNGWWNKNLRSLPSMLDAIFGDHVIAAKVMKLIGEEKASKGRRLVKSGTERYIDGLANVLNKGSLNTVEGRAKVTAAALLLRYDGYHGLTAEEEFQAVKKDLATNVKNWEGDADFAEELNASELALSFAEQFKTKEDLIQYVNDNQGIKNVVGFVQNAFAEQVDAREKASEYYFNTPLLRVADNYAPKKIIFKDGRTDESKPFEEKIAKVGLKQKQAGSINPAQKPGNLGKNNLNLDILTYSSFELENVLQEMHLSESRLMAHEALVNSEEFKGKINPSTARMLKEKIELQYNPIRLAPDNYYFARINEAMRQIGTAAVLGGFTQPIKQSSVLANIAATLGSDADVFMYELATGLKNFKGLSMVNPVVKSQVSNKIHDMYSIGSRVEMNVGIDRGETMKQRRAIPHTGARLVSNTLEFIGKARGVASDLFLYPMHVQDIFISTATWNAAYKSYLAKNGITNIDMKNEHLKIENDAIRQEAAAYAEQIVGVTQIPSDAAQRAEMMKDASLGIKFLRGVAMPFSNFAFNTMVRKFDSIRGIFTKGRAMKSGRELAGLVAESAAFSLSKYYIATALYPTIMNAMYSVLTGDDEDWIKVDDEEKERRLKMSRDFLIKDLVLQGVQDGIAEDIILGYNKLMYASCVNNDLTDKTYDEWVKSSSASLYQYKKAKELATESAGVYGIMPSKLMEAYSTTKLRQDHGVETKYGEKILKLTKKEEEALYLIETIQWMNATGMFDADATVMAGKAKSKIVRDAPKEKKPFDPKQFIKNIEKQIRDIEKGVQ